MRYSVVQVDVKASSWRRENIGLVAEDAMGRLRETLIVKNSLAAQLALGETSFRSLARNIGKWYESGDWKRSSPKSFLEFLSKSKLFSIRFSLPQPVPEIGEALSLLYKTRVAREYAAKTSERILTTRGLNLVLLMHFLSQVESIDKLRLQKSLYLAELSQDALGCSGLKYGFFRYLHGPFSREIYSHLDSLEGEGMVARDRVQIRITDVGRNFLGEASAILRDFPAAVKILEETVGTWRNRSTHELIAAAYATVPMQQSAMSDDLLPLVPEERFSWIPTSAHTGLITKIETILLSTQKRIFPGGPLNFDSSGNLS